MKLNPLQIRSYKIEYETTSITKEQLRLKYQLPDTLDISKWEKVATEVETLPNIVEVLPPPPSTSLPDPATLDTHIAKIGKFKELALDHCIKFMQDDAEFAEVKEFKDIVAIVDTLEKSYQKADPEAGKPTINIMINNLMERFKDDC